jgi:hypothetical protein
MLNRILIAVSPSICALSLTPVLKRLTTPVIEPPVRLTVLWYMIAIIV